jgi:IS3 family element, transposase orfA
MEDFIMPQPYDEPFKKKIVRLHLEEDRSMRSLTEEYGVSKSSVVKWCNEFREECQSNPESQKDYDTMEAMLKLKKENEELRKENLFLKKAAAFFAKEID